MGRSRGGLTTKIHLLCDAQGLPVRFSLTAGQVHDSKEALPLLEGFSPKAVLADKGYDSDAIVEHIEALKAEVVIPPKSNRKIQREFDVNRHAKLIKFWGDRR